MAPIRFQIPEGEHPEPGQPDRIEHGCDYMLQPDGKLEFYYNFLVYTWHLGGEEVSARMYLDDRHQVSVFVKGERLRDDPALKPLIRYLQRRFLLIKSFHADDAGTEGTGYVLQFQRADAMSAD